MTRRLLANPPQSIFGIATAYGVPEDAVRGILRHTDSIDLTILVIETAVSRGIALVDALYLVKAEWVI
jgi:hypothetical protein